jgi:hypothetical protein
LRYRSGSNDATGAFIRHLEWLDWTRPWSEVAIGLSTSAFPSFSYENRAFYHQRVDYSSVSHNLEL